MRKPLVLIMVAFLCFPMFQFAHLISSSSQSSTQILGVGNSVVENGGFEQGLTGWANGGNGFLAVSGENPHSGNYSLEISSPINQQAYFCQYVDLPNNSFTFSFWLYRVDPKSWTACYLGRDWDGNTIRPVSSFIIQDDTIELNAWDNPYAPGRQVFNYDVTVGSWHNVTFLANATLGNQDFYIDGSLVKNLNSSSGNVFSPNVLIIGDVSNGACNGTFYFDDFELSALGTANEAVFISISTESESAVVGFAVNISGTLADSHGVFLNNETVVLYCALCGVDNVWSPIASDSTDDLGHYYVQWIPSATGYFVVKAVYAGNSTHVGASNDVTLSILPYSNEYVFSVESNSTVSGLIFIAQNMTLNFEVSGAEGTIGYIRMTLAKNLAPDINKLKIQMDSLDCNYDYQETNASWIVILTYTHSVHQVHVNFGQMAIGEFSPIVFSLLLVTIGILLTILRKKTVHKIEP